jgi:hypothetical protein
MNDSNPEPGDYVMVKCAALPELHFGLVIENYISPTHRGRMSLVLHPDGEVASWSRKTLQIIAKLTRVTG